LADCFSTLLFLCQLITITKHFTFVFLPIIIELSMPAVTVLIYILASRAPQNELRKAEAVFPRKCINLFIHALFKISLHTFI
jgi:hypothetical protein